MNPCKICPHPDRAAIEQQLAEGASLRVTAARYGVSKDSIRRHWRTHRTPQQTLAGNATAAEWTALPWPTAPIQTAPDTEQKAPPQPRLRTAHEALLAAGWFDEPDWDWNLRQWPNPKT